MKYFAANQSSINYYRANGSKMNALESVKIEEKMNLRLLLPSLSDTERSFTSLLVYGNMESRNILSRIREKYNLCFQRTKFYKQNSNVLHNLLPNNINQSKFLQIYFLNDENNVEISINYF